jgi:heme/copper-type cytochrome/quinol oxidase subunit 2
MFIFLALIIMCIVFVWCFKDDFEAEDIEKALPGIVVIFLAITVVSILNGLRV